MAASTCEGVTLPEEQAEPEDSATPSTSKAATMVSAERPGRAKAIVLPTRAASQPNMATSGAISSTPACNMSRKPASRPVSSTREASAFAAAAPKPAMAATFSVPPRKPRSCPPPRTSALGSEIAPNGGERARALGTAELVARQEKQVGARRVEGAIDAAITLNRVANQQHRRRHEPAPPLPRPAESRLFHY